MFYKTFPLTCCACLLASGAYSAPVNALSEVSYFHNYTINSGNAPTGLGFDLGPLQNTVNATTLVDAPGTNVTTVPFVQIANPNEDPSVPYIARRTVQEDADGDHTATASYNINRLFNADEDAVFAIVGTETDNAGAASYMSVDGSVSGGASSQFDLDRIFEYDNNSIFTISFNIVGEFSANVLASFEGDNGLARSSLLFGLGIDASEGVSVTYLPLAPYLRDIDDGDTGAIVNELLQTSDNGFDFSASASATASGGETLASFDGGFRYALLITMDSGATFELNERFAQTNAVDYRATDLPPVPLPAALPLFVIALGSLAGLARRRR